jgi:acetylornithine deacetylase/succinyl-diaminopimelate desuccinylase family protein
MSMELRIAVDEKELMTLLRQLIAINSVNPCLGSGSTGETEIAGYIADRFQQMGLNVKTQTMGPDRINVIGILEGTGEGPTLMLNGHTDTVTANAMEIEPFTPKVSDGKVYGRGALDMKGGVAAQIMAVQAIVKSGIQLKGNVLLACVADEEYMSIGTEKLLEEFKADAAVICEPTDLTITTAHKGFAWTTVEVFGKAAHGSRPSEGIDAIIKAGKFLAELEKLNQDIFPLKIHPLLGLPSLHASMIKGGTEWSTYPDYCKIELERRTLPGETRGFVQKEMQTILDNIKKFDPDFEAKQEMVCFRQPFEITTDRKIVKTLDQACRIVMNRKPAVTGATFWMDASFLAAGGIPTVVFGPSGEGLHAAIEYVDFQSVVTTANVLIQTILDFCN